MKVYEKKDLKSFKINTYKKTGEGVTIVNRRALNVAATDYPRKGAGSRV